jgi:predicted nucleic acid-binding protein
MSKFVIDTDTLVTGMVQAKVERAIQNSLDDYLSETFYDELWERANKQATALLKKKAPEIEAMIEAEFKRQLPSLVKEFVIARYRG